MPPNIPPRISPKSIAAPYPPANILLISNGMPPIPDIPLYPI